ncbi:hypothetical protein GQ42DRAFT_161614 [Ramicandelaber brevisporus]|nr:hypothetical protein GQ42DRAFT_161614 [Ramicandelaber brevisporus]
MQSPQQAQLAQQQQQQQQQQQAQQQQHVVPTAKRRRAVDRTLPSHIGSYIPESRLYGELQAFEKRLDGLIQRKRLDFMTAMGESRTGKRVLRLFISNLAQEAVYTQTQTEAEDGSSSTVSTLAQPASWTLRIEGRLLDPPNVRVNRVPQPVPCSRFIHTLVVESNKQQQQQQQQQQQPEQQQQQQQQQQDGPDGPESESKILAEWSINKQPDGAGDVHGFEIKRTVSENDINANNKVIPVRIIIRLTGAVERYKLSPKLAELLGVELMYMAGTGTNVNNANIGNIAAGDDSGDENVMNINTGDSVNTTESITKPELIQKLKGYGGTMTLPEIINNVVEYIKFKRLLDPDDASYVIPDEKLGELFGGVRRIALLDIHESIRKHLLPPDPIVIDYNIHMDREYTMSRFAYDIQVDVADFQSVQEMNLHMQKGLGSPDVLREIQKADDQLGDIVGDIHERRIRRDFMQRFSTQPALFIREWLEHQSRDLEVIVGDNRVNWMQLRDSTFYRKNWTREATSLYLAALDANAISNAVNSATSAAVNENRAHAQMMQQQQQQQIKK